MLDDNYYYGHKLGEMEHKAIAQQQVGVAAAAPTSGQRQDGYHQCVGRPDDGNW